MGVGKLTRYGLPYSNVVATGVATNNVTPGRTINNMQLKLGGTTFTKAMLSLIKIKANGKVIMEFTGAQADKLNAYRGQTTDVAYLDMPFFERAGLTEFDRAVGGFDTSRDIANITTEVTIAGATAPTLQMILTESAQQADAAGNPAPFAGVMSKVLRYPFAMATGGTLPVTVPFGAVNGAVIKRLHVEHNGGLMTGATVKQDGLVIHESLKLENEYEQKRWGRVPQTNLYTIDFMVDGNVNKALDTRSAKQLEWLLTFSGADSGYIIVEYLDTLGNL
jgi:hypothetical protein